MLKPYSELRKIDVLPFCEKRKAKDENNKAIEVAYLPWAKCMDLLHEHGAEVVYYLPVADEHGGFAHVHKEVRDKDGKTGGCYFVRVEVHIDDKVYPFDYPLLNGTYVVKDEGLNQLRISNAHARAFVKCVAIFTGLGFDLWLKDERPDEEDLSIHNIYSIKKRIEQRLTETMQRMDYKDVLAALNINEKQLNGILKSVDNVAWLDSELRKL